MVLRWKQNHDLLFSPPYVHHSQHRIDIYQLRAEEQNINRKKNGSEENAYELIMDMMGCMWIWKRLINWP